MTSKNYGAARSTDTLCLEAVVKEFGPRVWRFFRYLGVLEPDLGRLSKQVFACFNSASIRELECATTKCAVYQSAVRIWYGYEPQSGFARQSSSTDARSRDARTELLVLLATLSPQQRMVTTLYEIEELAIDEIAEVLCCERKQVLRVLHESRAEFMKARTGAADECDSFSPHVASKVR